MQEHDYIIVGAGGAGAVLADRLSEDPATSVLLLERGGRGWHPLLHVPKGFFFTLRSPALTTTYRTEPVASDSPGTWVRGRVLGGSTAVNGMMYIRGQAADFDALQRRGNPGWGWDRVLTAYRAIEDHSLGSSPTRGSGGPVGISVATGTRDETVRLILAAARNAGWPFTDDVNVDDGQRIGFTPSTIRRGVRQSTANTFLRRARRRPNLTVVTGTTVDRLRFDGRRVVGVSARAAGRGVDYAARREVLICAGTVETPLLLERSGIGHPAVLARAGVPLRVASPNVGERVIEQRGVSMQARFRRPVGQTMSLASTPRQLWQGARYLLTRGGPIATAGYDLVAQIRSGPGVDRPDLQVVIVPFALDLSHRLDVADHPGMYLLGYQLRPTTRSSVHITTSAPDAPPEIRARYVQDEEDRRVTATIAGHLRSLLAQEPLRSEIAREEPPGDDVSIHHAVGSAAMGPDADDVVDPQLRVRGVEGLRVADLSVLPHQVSGNSAAPAMAIGWLAADLIRSTSAS